MKVQHCKSHGVLIKNAGSGSSGCISVRSCRSAAAADFRDCEASGSATAARTSGPCAISRALAWTALPQYAGVVTFRLRGGLPRGVGVLGDRRLGLSALGSRTGAPFSVNQNWQQVETAASSIKLQLAWPDAALPRCAGVMVVPSLRRPASRCRGSWRPPAGAQLHLHTCVKGSAQAVKPDVFAVPHFKKKVISSSTVSTEKRM